MEYKNFKWKFANSVIVLVVIVYFILFVLTSILFIFVEEYNLIPWTLATLAVMLIPTYFIFLILGNILYKKNKIKITNEGIYQNKRFLENNNIRSADIGGLFNVFYFQINPIKNGVFVSKRILLYFYSIEEACHYVISNDLVYLLNRADYNLVMKYMQNIIENVKEELEPYFINIFDKYKTTCDCCGNKTIFKEAANSICPVCFWEKDDSIIYNPSSVSEFNHISLSEAKINYEKYGACEEQFINHVRKPYSYEKSNF